MNKKSPDHYLRTIIVIVLVTLGVQFALVAWTFPLGTLLSATPLLNIDNAYHWYQVQIAQELAAQGQLVGYDPYFAAGYVGGVTLNASAKMPALLTWLLGKWLSVEQSYKLYVFTAAIVAPALVPIAAGIRGISWRAVSIAAALGLLAWWASAFRWYHTAGMVGFVLASYMVLPYVALLIRAAAESTFTFTQVVMLGALGAAGFLLHPLFPVPVAFLMGMHLVAERREIVWSRALPSLIAIAIISLLPNLVWIIPALGPESHWVGAQPYQQRVDAAMIVRELVGLWNADSKGSKLYAGLFVASVCATVLSGEGTSKRYLLASVSAWLALVLFAALSGALPALRGLQPNRFSSAAYLFLVIPAAIGAIRLLDWRQHQIGRSKVLATAVAGLCTLSFGWSAFELTREVSWKPIGHYGALPPEVKEVAPRSKWLLEWLAANTTREGRILFETSLGRVHDGAHMAGYYARTSDREFIGGPYPFMFNAGFWDGFAFGKQLNLIPIIEFERYLTTYNVGWIVAHSIVSKQYFASIPSITYVAGNGGLEIFRVNQPLTYFHAGSGVIQGRGINRLVLSDLSGDDITIKYHYVAGLTAHPDATVAPVWLPGVDRPFIRITARTSDRLELAIR